MNATSAPHPRLDASPPARPCLECGGAMAHGAAPASFCATACRKAWNNRRAIRGAELYDLVMALRFDRALATRLHLWRIVCRMASAFRREDHQQRDGRRSWAPPAQVIDRRPYLAATVVARGVAGGRKAA